MFRLRQVDICARCPVWALKPGMEVARQVYDANGHLLLNAGVRLEISISRS